MITNLKLASSIGQPKIAFKMAASISKCWLPSVLTVKSHFCEFTPSIDHVIQL